MGKNNVKIIIGSHALEKSDWLYNHFLKLSRKEDGKMTVLITSTNKTNILMINIC